MKTFDLQSEQWIPRPLGEVFPFFASAENLQQITPPWVHFQIVTDRVEMRAGARIDYKLRIHGLPVHWQSEITVWEPAFRFVDVQVRGPYRIWIHEHTFEVRDGGTLMRDHVQYAVTGGALVQKLLVAPDLERIFRFRRDHLQFLFGGAH